MKGESHVLLVTTEEMRGIDKKCQEMGVPSLILMENAGRALAMESLKLLSGRSHGDTSARIVVLCGPGQNGGDGFVAARHLSSMGHEVAVVVAGDTRRLPYEAGESFKMLSAYPVSVLSPEEFLKKEWEGPDLIVDALLGTGTRGAPRAPIADLIRWANERDCPIVACDIPSGLNGDTGYAYEPCIKADLTVTMGFAKVGLYSYPGRMFCGEIVVEGLGLPPQLTPDPPFARAVFVDDLEKVMPKRQADHHKGRSGHVTVIAGSLGMAGAAILCAEASLRVGAGTVTLLVPRPIYEVCASKFPEVMVLPCGDDPWFTSSPDTLDIVKRYIERSSAAAVGPGFGRGHGQAAFLKDILPYLSKVPCVIDADGLFALRELGGLGYLSELGGNFTLTPHPGEMSRLIDLPVEEIGKDRPGVAKKAAMEGRSVVCLKGAGTIVANPSAHIWVNTSGTPALATGGSGDVLAGVIAGLLAQGLKPDDGAVLGVYWHGLCGEIAEERKGPLGVTASDLLEFLPEAGRRILSHARCETYGSEKER